MKYPTVFFGSGEYVLPILETLVKNYAIKLVVTTEKKADETIPMFCKKNNIPYVSLSTLTQLKTNKEKLIQICADFAVLANFGVIVSKEIIDLFPKGIVNIHPSLLPSYRGPTPGQTPIVLGDVTTGVSIMLLDSTVDHGPILAQEKEFILSTDTGVSLYTRLFAKAAKLLEKVLPEYLDGTLTPKEQDHNKATFTKVLTRESGFFSDTKPVSAGLLERLIRAYYPWPGVWTKVTTLPSSQLQGKTIKFLPGKKIQVEGKKPMSYKDFYNGYLEGKELLQKLQLG